MIDSRLQTLTSELWGLAKQILVDDQGHHPIVFCFGADYKIVAFVAITGDGSVPLRDAVRSVIEQVRPFGFCFVSEAWDRGPAPGDKRECIVLQSATREVFEMKRIAFDRVEGGAVVLRSETELSVNSEMAGVGLVGAFPEMVELLPLLN